MDKTRLFRTVAFPSVMVAVCVFMALSQHTQFARTAYLVAAGSFFVFAANIIYSMRKSDASKTRGDNNGRR